MIHADATIKQPNKITEKAEKAEIDSRRAQNILQRQSSKYPKFTQRAEENICPRRHRSQVNGLRTPIILLLLELINQGVQILIHSLDILVNTLGDEPTVLLAILACTSHS